MRTALPAVLALASGIVSAAPTSPKARPLPLAFVEDLPLPGGATRFDYQWLDTTSRRLYLAHLGDSSLVVFDLDAKKVIHEVPRLGSVHGVVAAPTLHLVFATATADKELAIIDDQTFDVKARVAAGAYPNGLAVDPGSQKVFVSNNTGPGVAVVDVKAGKPLPSIKIGGGAGNTQWDADSGHILAAVHGGSYLADIDPATAALAGRIPLDHVTSCHGLLVASTLRQAFAVCHGKTPVLAVIDLKARKQSALLPLPGDIDVLAFDPELRRLYAAAETGMVVAFEVGGDGTTTELGRGKLAAHAHTVAVDPSTHRVYFPLESIDGKPVLRVMEPTGL